eukprot:1358363-Prymnesium_polylepis.1
MAACPLSRAVRPPLIWQAASLIWQAASLVWQAASLIWQVDLALASDELTIHWDDVKKAGGTRHPPGLKFLLTERMCSAAGGAPLIA